MLSHFGNQKLSLAIPFGLLSAMFWLGGTARAGKAERAADKVERAMDATTKHMKAGSNDSWLTARAKIALFADGRVSGAKGEVKHERNRDQYEGSREGGRRCLEVVDKVRGAADKASDHADRR